MRIAAYCRVSTGKEDQLDSLEHQKEFFIEYAKKNGHTLVQVYADEGISGMSLKHRAEFNRLMKDAELHLFDMLVVKDISRFARNTVDFLQSIRTLKKFGINTLFLTANMESLGESEFVLTVFSALAQEESVNLSKRVKFGKQINTKMGRVPHKIFGYDRVDNFHLRINDNEAAIVRKIFELYLYGMGGTCIAQALNANGCTTKTGLQWKGYTVRRILRNSIYCGQYVNNKYEIADCLEHTRTIKDENQWLVHDRPEWAIISRDIFDQAQKQMAHRRQEYNSKTQKGISRYSYKHIFSMLIKCDCCGRSFTRKHYKNNGKRGAEIDRYCWKCITYDAYSAKGPCHNRVTINETDLIEHIREYLKSLIEDPKTFVQQIIDEAQSYCKSTPNEDVVQLKQKKASMQARRKKYQEMYAADLMTIDELKIEINKISDEMEMIDYKIKSSEMPLDPNDSNGIIDQYRKEIESFLNLETITSMDIRKIIDHIDAKADGEIIIHLKHLA